MSLRTLCQWVQDQPSSIALRESQYGYPAVETAHVLGMAMFAGLIAMMDLRLVGIGNRRTPVSEIQARLFPWQMTGLATSVISGTLLLYAEPVQLYGNIFWWIKVGLLVVAGVNALAFHLTTYRSVAKWDRDPVTPFGARLAGTLSLVLWTGVIVSGRLIAYNWFK